MLDIEKLEKVRKENYKTCFERWYKRNDIERKIEVANSRGFDELTMTTSPNSENIRIYRMVKDDDFLNHLEIKLPGFRVWRKIENKKGILYDTEIIRIGISWKR